jgi:hypothetical protein
MTFKIKEERDTEPKIENGIKVKVKEPIEVEKLVMLDFVGLKYVFRSNYLVDKQ